MTGAAVAGEAGEGTGEASGEVTAVPDVVVAKSPEEFNEWDAAIVDIPDSSAPETGSP